MKAVLLAPLLLPGSVAAMSGHDYLEYCRASTVYDRAQCMGYLDALLRRNSGEDFRSSETEVGGALDTAAVLKADRYCLPTGTGLPLLRDVVVRMLGQLPARRLEGDAAPLIDGILRRTYPAAGCTD